MDLDKKLEEILKKGTFAAEGTDKVFFTFDGIVGEVKQAFIDDGWVRIPQVELEHHPDAITPTLYTVNGKEVLTQSGWEAKAIKDGWVHMSNLAPSNYMTGQEWYDRFDEAYRDLAVYPVPNPLHLVKIDSVRHAAKKAAGIE